MSRFNINFHFSGRNFIKQLIIIALSVVAIILFNKYFPQEKLPKSFIFKTAIYALIYILFALIVESIFRKFDDGEKK